MSGKNVSVKSNFLYNSIFQVLILIVPFITTPYVSRVLGAENIGKYSYASAMVTYFTLLASLGSTTYGQRKIAYYRDDKKELSQVFWNTFLFRCVMSVLAFVFYMGYIYFIEGLNSINIIIALSIFNVAFDISWFFQGLEEFKNVVIRNIVVRFVCLGGIFVFVKTSGDIEVYVLILMLSQVLGSFSMWRLISKHIVLVKEINPFKGFKEILQIFLPTIAIQVYTILDKSMIGWITGSDYANGCYEQSERIARLAMSVVTSVGTVVLPRVANLFHKDNFDEAKRYVYMAFRVVWMMAIPIMFGLLSVSSVFIPLFLGEGFSDAIILLCIFSVLVLVVSLAYVVGLSYLVPTKQQNVYTVAVTVAACVNFAINMILIPRIGAVGAAIASVFAETVGTLIQIIYCVVKKQLSAKQIFIPCWKYLLSGVIMFVVVSALKIVFAKGIVALCILIVAGGVCYTIMLLILKDDFFVSNVSKTIKKVIHIANSGSSEHGFR